ncbi:Rieske (2Fe-2S) protein [Azoarcus olearius]|uniref:Conserved hypothetical ferredoxin protein n=1 Tax=Azoarcus sp. (strain BH72) TaxID=418699 RepID=A1K5X8_AZOSB|nr:Rieske 2Fe-2S domain-containing protein [Azoarcus olearius]ANQ84783.1 ferredoxin protein [Azoarcus olearius]CAL94233.1 conserved hypothetical ferredoxin protein [Azoarcus olearius]
MAARERLICAASELADGGDGVRFTVERFGVVEPAFAVRYRGAVYAYLNRCAHVPVELDWVAGKFFDLSGTLLICAVHGAHYEPESGQCVMGPCKGRRLIALNVVERAGHVYLHEDEGL